MHIYQRSVEGFNIFYGIEDYLVFFMIFLLSLYSLFIILRNGNNVIGINSIFCCITFTEFRTGEF